MRKGDFIVAAFRQHRFAGYGLLTSDFYRGGPSLNIPCRRGSRDIHAFQERFNVDWTIIPFEKAPPFICCTDLKTQGYDIDLTRGLCIKPTDKRTFGELQRRLDKAGARRFDKSFAPLSQETLDTPDVYEGAVRQVSVNAYERNPQARRQCIAHYGARCAVCERTLEEIYGEPGRDQIHVHHLRELSTIRQQYKVDPIQDLRPVCPNCHAIIHSRTPAYSIEEVRGFLKITRSAG
ncbi:MAG: HNH endonuclease [Synergistales bacterium]|nr:HNH endonuclease [Synergistales bacterium]